MNPITINPEVSTGTMLTAPTGEAYTTPVPLDARALYSSEVNNTDIKNEMNMFDAVIGAAMLVIIGLIILLVATSNKTPKEEKKMKK